MKRTCSNTSTYPSSYTCPNSCPNSCSGHGTCGTFDECICYPNWQEADCSGRTSPFAAAHVDTPKGDLDGSADALSGTGTTVIAGSTVYPHGTTEQYPLMVDSAGGSLTNTGHAYAECGNKGICDRKSGECDCFPGYSGAGCQKAACGDATCSGHGVCMSAQDLAAADHGNVYNLWDSEVTMGCKCEPGYSGPTCESKMCKHGLDPLYIDDDYMTIRAPTARVLLQYVNVTGNLEAMDELGNADADGDLSTGLSITGTYAIKFYDAFGEDYQTDPLAATAGCIEIKAALESMANDIVPAGSVICSEITPNVGSLTARNKVEYDLTFTENLGDLKPIEINANLDGTRPSVYAIGHSGTDDNKVKFDVDVKVLEGWRAVRAWRAARREVWSFLTSTCALAIWHSLAVLVRFSSVEDVDYPGAFKWLMRIYALVTFDLAAWLPTPCAGWSYYHTLLMATLLPLYLVLVVALVSLCSRDPDAKRRACRRLAVLLIMCHATVCSVLFEFFHLDGVEYHTADERGFRTSATERELYLARDYTIRASSKRYQAYRAYAILCCLIYVVGLPGLFLCGNQNL